MDNKSQQEYGFQSQAVDTPRKVARRSNRLVRNIERLLFFYLFTPPAIILVSFCLLERSGHFQALIPALCVCFLFYLLGASFLTKRVARDATAKIDSLLPVLADFSHELSSPLVTLGGIINTLGNADKREENNSDLLARLRHCHQRISSLHQDLRVLAGWGEPLRHSELSIFNPVQLVQACLAEMKERCDEKEISLIFSEGASSSLLLSSSSPSPPSSPSSLSPSPLPSPAANVMVADREAIARVLINLLENAWKYCPVGSSITVSVTGSRDNIKIEVADNGPGLPPQILQRIFEREYRAVCSSPNAPAGSGLGIFIAREIVECHGGRLTVEPVTPKGLKFTVNLPSLPTRHPFMQLFDRTRD